MPRLNGIEAAKKIRQVCPESSIIFLSLESDSDVRAAALATGAVAYLMKSTANCKLRPAIEMAFTPPSNRTSEVVGIRKLIVPVGLAKFFNRNIRQCAYRKATIQTYKNLRKRPHDRLVQTLKSRKVESKFTVEFVLIH